MPDEIRNSPQPFAALTHLIGQELDAVIDGASQQLRDMPPATSPLAEPVPAAVALDGTPAESWLAALRHADAQIAQATGIRGRAIEHLQAAMGDATEATVAGNTVITWRHSKPGRTLDRKALEAAYGADVIAGFDRDKKAARPFKVLGQDGA